MSYIFVFLLYLTTLSVVQTIQRWWKHEVNDEFEVAWKEGIVAGSVLVISSTEDNREKLRLDGLWAEILTLDLLDTKECWPIDHEVQLHVP